MKPNFWPMRLKVPRGCNKRRLALNITEQDCEKRVKGELFETNFSFSTIYLAVSETPQGQLSTRQKSEEQFAAQKNLFRLHTPVNVSVNLHFWVPAAVLEISKINSKTDECCVQRQTRPTIRIFGESSNLFEAFHLRSQNSTHWWKKKGKKEPGQNWMENMLPPTFAMGTSGGGATTHP